MSEKKYNWTRFWSPREAKISVNRYGALEDPLAPYGELLNPSSKTLESLAEVRCLALLGEPGLGKSVEMSQHLNFSRTDSSAIVLDFQLRDYQTDFKLCADIFESPKLRNWLESDQKLFLFLDSLDEGLLTIETLATLLIRELTKLPRERLYLRIASRTAEWPKILEEGLRKHWGAEDFRAFELSPLREKDIREAALSEGVDSDKFFHELMNKQAGPLAIKPVTLKFLISSFLKFGELPDSQVELYAKGCEFLCEESNPSRIASRRVGPLSIRRRFQVAQRIAAISIFSNKSAIWTGLQSETPYGDITVADLVPSCESIGPESFPVEEAEVREVLGTGLFNSRGSQRMGWAHQTYAEFLAASYLTDHNVSLEQKLSIICCDGGRVIPQLYETAAWLASMDHSVFKELMTTDPALMLRSDVAGVDDSQRAALVDALLNSANNEEWSDTDWSLSQNYSKLDHPTLSDQLRPFIGDRLKSFLARRIATDVAEACVVSSLQDDLVHLVLDANENIDLRVNAAYAVARTGTVDSKAKLRPLALGKAGDDPDEQLKGCGLQAIWPESISNSELFAILTWPKRNNFFGSYRSFIGSLERNVDSLDLTEALHWLASSDTNLDHLGPFHALGGAILRRAWESFDVPEIRIALSNLMISSPRKLRGYEKGRITLPDEQRRVALKMLISKFAEADGGGRLYYLVHESRLVNSSDVQWLIDQIESEDVESVRKFLAELLERVFDFRNTADYEIIISASAKIPILAYSFRNILQPVHIGSLQAEAARKSYSEWYGLDSEKSEAPSPITPTPGERVRQAIDRFESGDPDGWWHLNFELRLNENGEYNRDEVESDLTNQPGWKAATGGLKAEILECAKRFLLFSEPSPEKWLGKNILYRPAYAGYRAFRLILTEDPSYLDELPVDVWTKWACILVNYPFQSETTDHDAKSCLLEHAYRLIPEEISRLVLLAIDAENKKGGYISVLSHLANCWDDAFCAMLLARLKRKGLKISCFGQILSELLDKDFTGAKRYAQYLLLKLSNTPSALEKRLAAARALVTHASDAGWEWVWPAIERDTIFGRQLMEICAGVMVASKNPLADRLGDVDLAKFYAWLVREYAYATDPKHDGVHSVGPDELVRRLRDSILNQLKSRGTREAIAEINKLVGSFPELGWLKQSLLEAQEMFRRKNWIPFQPLELLKIAKDSDARLVQSGDQLIEVVIESLTRLQKKLCGETPAAVYLWNEVEKGVFEPKDENALSDYVKIHFDEDLKSRAIVANREVEIRGSKSQFRGQETDIHIDAITKDSAGTAYDQITVIVETKGCWNRDLNRAMDTQLVGRYLKDHSSPFGVYLIGWFICPQWNITDPRKKEAAKGSLGEYRNKFSHQAAALSIDGATVKAFVLDASLPVSVSANKQAVRRKAKTKRGRKASTSC